MPPDLFARFTALGTTDPRIQPWLRAYLEGRMTDQEAVIEALEFLSRELSRVKELNRRMVEAWPAVAVGGK